MPAEILSGKEIAEDIKREVAGEVAELESSYGFRPCLSLVRVGEDPASKVYVGSKVKTSEELGMISEHHHLDESVTQEELLRTVRELNEREDVDGILVQLPLPKQIDENTILDAIDPIKDVDGLHPFNAGRLAQGRPVLVSCTPAGIIEMLKRSNIEMAGRRAVVIGRSNIVGKPVAFLLLQENATVTICHSRTKDLAAVASEADILVAAIGRAGFVRADFIKPGAVVVDVGINNVSDEAEARTLFGADEIEKRLRTIEKRGFTLVGDVNPREARERAAYFTPVPGGVGLLTVAMLMKNTVTAARMRRLGQ